MAVRQNTVRKSTSAGGAASCRAAFGLLAASASGSVGVLEGGEELAAKNEEERKEHENP